MSPGGKVPVECVLVFGNHSTVDESQGEREASVQLVFQPRTGLEKRE